MKSNLKRLQEENPTLKIHTEIVYFIDHKVLVTKKFVAKDMGVSERHILNWEKEGFEASEYSLPRMKLYDIKALKKWHRENYLTVDENTLDENSMYKVGDEITAYNAKSAKEVEEAHIKAVDRRLIEIKEKEVAGEYIKADDVDKITTEMVVVLLSAWRNLLEILPPLLTNKKQHEVRSILDDEFEAEVEVLDRKINA